MRAELLHFLVSSQESSRYTTIPRDGFGGVDGAEVEVMLADAGTDDAATDDLELVILLLLLLLLERSAEDVVGKALEGLVEDLAKVLLYEPSTTKHSSLNLPCRWNRDRCGDGRDL